MPSDSRRLLDDLVVRVLFDDLLACDARVARKDHVVKLADVDVPVSSRGDLDTLVAQGVGALALKGDQVSIGPARLAVDVKEATVGRAKIALILSTADGLGIHLDATRLAGLCAPRSERGRRALSSRRA